MYGYTVSCGYKGMVNGKLCVSAEFSFALVKSE